MRCAQCRKELGSKAAAFTGHICPHCRKLAHPTRLGHYGQLRLLKRGGMGSVYEGRHEELGTRVAIKLLNSIGAPDVLYARFQREARLAARIPHPGVVRVFEHDRQEGRLYLVMERIEGETLRDALQRSPLPIGWVQDKMAQLAEVLQAAHEQGIVHRDIKPENVMVDSTGRVRVLDFGISKISEETVQLTKPGELLGTPQYIAPEQVLDVQEEVDARADLHAWGVVCYELLTGRCPFAGKNLFQTLRFVESLTPPAPSQERAETPRGLSELIMSCLAKDKEERPGSATELLQELQPVHASAGDRATEDQGGRRSGPLALVAVGVFALAVGFLLGTLPKRTEAFTTSEPAPAARIEALLSTNRSAPNAIPLLREAARGIADDAGATSLYWRGRALYECGALLHAERDLRHAAGQDVASAKTPWRVVWIHVHRLLPRLLDGAPWLSVGTVEWNSDGTPLQDGLYALASGDFHTARERLQGLQPEAVPDQDALWLLCLLGLGRQEEATTYFHARSDSWKSSILGRLYSIALGEEKQAADALRDIAAQLDRLDGLRYVLEMMAAARSHDLQALRATCELAVVSGDSLRILPLYLGIRAWLGGGPESSALFAWSEECRSPGFYGLKFTRCVIAAQATQQTELKEALESIPEDPGPALPLFQAWRSSAGESRERFYNAWVRCYSADRHRALNDLELWYQAADSVSDADPLQLGRLCIAAALLGESSAEQLRPQGGVERARGFGQLVQTPGNIASFLHHGSGYPLSVPSVSNPPELKRYEELLRMGFEQGLRAARDSGSDLKKLCGQDSTGTLRGIAESSGLLQRES